jgi:alpha-galactosidase
VVNSHRIYAGKPTIPGLSSLYTERTGEADTLELKLFDELSGLSIILYYTIFADLPAITRHSRFVNEGKKPLAHDQRERRVNSR